MYMYILYIGHDCYWIFQYWKYRKSMIIHKRYPELLVLSLACGWTYFLIITTALGVWFEYLDVSQNNPILDTSKPFTFTMSFYTCLF